MGRPVPALRIAPSPTVSSTSLGKHTSHTQQSSTATSSATNNTTSTRSLCCNTLSEQDADWIVKRTELRVSQVIAKSAYIQEHCRLHELPRYSHEELEIGECIASGGFSNVHQLEGFIGTAAIDSSLAQKAVGSACGSSSGSGSGCNGTPLVVKHLNPKLANEPKKMAVGAKDLLMEAHFLSSFDHENIIQLRGVCSYGVAGYAETGRADGFFLIFDQLEGTLSHKMNQWRCTEAKSSHAKSTLFGFKKASKKKNTTTFHDRIKAALDIATAITHLHENGILYRDLKPGNVGFHPTDGRLQIFDFGLAVELPHSDDPNQLYNLAGNTGTARYMAPEIIQNKPYNFKADVFSFMTILWEILALKKPFAELSGPEVKEWVAEFGNRPSISRSWPSDIRKMMKAGWSETIEDRPTMKQVRETLEAVLKDL